MKDKKENKPIENLAGRQGRLPSFPGDIFDRNTFEKGRELLETKCRRSMSVTRGISHLLHVSSSPLATRL